MTNQVTFPTNVGGDGSTVTDDSNATTGLANGGFRTRLVPMFTQIVNIANWILGRASAAATSAANAAASEGNAAESAIASADFASTSGGAATAAGNSATLSGQWAALLGSQVAGTDYSAKAYAVGTGGNAPTVGSAKDWATKAGGTVDGTGYSAAYWAAQAAASAQSIAGGPLTGSGAVTAGHVAVWNGSSILKDGYAVGGANGLLQLDGNSYVPVANLSIAPASGDILYTARNPGTGYLKADGSVYAQSSYAALFAVLGLLGISWLSRTNPLGPTGMLGICYGNGQYVAGGNSGALLTSPDGINWTSRTSG